MTLPVTCLVVDDLDDNLLALSAVLRGDGVDVLTARSGPEALELLLVHDVALTFLDVQMPGMDGFEVAELMRGSPRTRHVPIIFVTAAGRDQRRLFRGYETGAVDFLFKPLDPHILRNKAEVFFQLHRQRQLLAQELRERTETLRLNEMFQAVLGHDLRSPLSAMVAAAEIFHRSPDPTAREAAVRMLSSGKRMSRMIEDMLDVARARLAGGIPLQRESIDLGVVVQRAVQELQTSYPARAIDLELVGDLGGEWDADRFAQVVSNLVGNALQHGRADAPVRVRVDGAAADAVVFSVASAGAIPEEILPHLFDPFRRAHRAARRTSGLGLGLYIVQQIAEAHGGRVEVRSSEAEGTRFEVAVPRGRAP